MQSLTQQHRSAVKNQESVKDLGKARKWTVVGVRNKLQYFELFTVNENECPENNDKIIKRSIIL